MKAGRWTDSSIVTPKTAEALLNAGFAVNVERSPVRIFEDNEFGDIGANLVPEGSWVDAPSNHVIIGLKELPEDSFPLKHTHVQFAHCFKNQAGWKDVLSRFQRGGGTLLDLEFLTDESGRRVAAFGYHAGYAGAALAIKAWAWQLTSPLDQPLPGVEPYSKQELLLEDVRAQIAKGTAKAGRPPRVIVIGALGRCGKGAIDFCRHVGIPEDVILEWDLEETSKGGPFPEIVESDIFVNCIYLSSPIPPFMNVDSLSSSKRTLRVVCDVSCDTTNPHNPIPVYTQNTTFHAPTLPVDVPNDPAMTVISIDHLPSLLPRESSEAFSEALLPSLLTLHNRTSSRVWQNAEELYKEKLNASLEC
jgi:saccharopine dehydrogenase (NAD+, L-lysine forming)